MIYLVLGGDEWEETWATYYRSFIDTLLMALACQTGKNFVSSVYWLVMKIYGRLRKVHCSTALHAAWTGHTSKNTALSCDSIIHLERHDFFDLSADKLSPFTC